MPEKRYVFWEIIRQKLNRELPPNKHVPAHDLP